MIDDKPIPILPNVPGQPDFAWAVMVARYVDYLVRAEGVAAFVGAPAEQWRLAQAIIAAHAR